MADYSGLDEAALNEKLKLASDYDERSAIRKAIRQLKREQGRPVGRAIRREATYDRFAGRASTATKAATPKSYIGKETTAEKLPARGATPTQTPPTHSPAPFSPPPSHTPPPPRAPSPLEIRQEPPHSHSPVPPIDEPDGIPPYTEEPEPPLSPEVPQPSPPPRSPSPARSPSPMPPFPQKFHEEVVDGTNEGVEAVEEEVEPDREEAEPDNGGVEPDKQEVEPDNEVEPDMEEVEPETEEVEPDMEEVEPDMEEVEPDREEAEPDNEGVEPDNEVEPDMEEVEPETEEVEPDNEEVEPDMEEVEPDTEEVEPDMEEVEPEALEPAKDEEVTSTQEQETLTAEPQVNEEEKSHPPEERPHPPEERPAVTSAEDTDDSPFGKRLRSRRQEAQTSSPQEKVGGAKAEFQGFKLRRTPSQEQRGPSALHGGGTHDFGVRLRSRESRPSPSTTDVIPSKTEGLSSPPRIRAKTFGSARQAASSSSGPRTLRDYQQLSARSQRAKVKSPSHDDEGGSTLPVEESQRYLVMYVNQELALSPAIPSRGKALYDVCSDATNLCKLINKSVRNTVDLRALTTLTPSMSASEREEAIQDNMTLTVESARAIGCRVTDTTGDLIIGKDPATIRSFLVDLIRARVVNMPGMEDEPTSTFTNLSVLFSKLGISEVDGEGVEEGGGGGERGGEEVDQEIITWKEKDSERLAKALKTPPKSPPTRRTWRERPDPSSPEMAEPASVSTELTYEERAARRRAERQRREQERGAKESLEGDTSGLTYKERAAMRRADRERRRQERTELAGSQ